MLVRALPFLLLVILTCRGPQENVDEDARVRALLKSAKDQRYNIDSRYRWACQADSIASRLSEQRLHIDCMLLISAIELQRGKIESAWQMVQKSAVLARNLRDMEGLAIATSEIASIHQSKGRYDSSIQYFLDAQFLFDSLGEQKKIAQNLVNTGIVYETQGNFDAAYKVDIRAATMLDSLHDTDDLASVRMSLADVQRELKQYGEALRYDSQALNIFFERRDSGSIALALNNIGNIYRDSGNFQKSLVNYFEALRIKKQLKDEREIAITLHNIGKSFLSLQDLDSAERYFKEALIFETSCNDTGGLIETSNSLAKLLLRKGYPRQALQLAIDASSKSSSNTPLQDRLANNLVLFDIYSELKRGDSAITFARKSFALKDSLLNERIGKEISTLNAQFNVQQKENEIQFHKQIESSQTQRIKTQYLTIILLAIILLLIVVTAILLQRANRRIKTLLRELNHRVQNNHQTLYGILVLQADKTQEIGQINLLKSLRNRVESMSIIHDLLYKDDYDGSIDMNDFIPSLVTNVSLAFGNDPSSLQTIIHVNGIKLNTDQAIPLGLVINELVTNVYKYGVLSLPNPVLEIYLSRKDAYTLILKDNCQPWNHEEFRTKKTGLGLSLVENFVKQLEGTWKIDSSNSGTIQTIKFK